MKSSTYPAKVHEDLQKYIKTKKVDQLINNILENVIKFRPSHMIAFIFDFLLKNYSEETKNIIKSKQYSQLQKQASHYMANLHLSPVNIQDYKLIEYIDTINRDVKKDLEDYLVINQLQNFITNIIEKILISETSNPFLAMAEILLGEFPSELLIIFMIKANNNSTVIASSSFVAISHTPDENTPSVVPEDSKVSSSSSISHSKSAPGTASDSSQISSPTPAILTIDDQYTKATESYTEDTGLFDIEDIDNELDTKLLSTTTEPTTETIDHFPSSNKQNSQSPTSSPRRKETKENKFEYNIYEANSDDSFSDEEKNTLEDDEMEDFKSMYNTTNPALIEQRKKLFTIAKRKFSVSSESISCEDALIELKKRIKEHKYHNGIYIKKKKQVIENQDDIFEVENDDDDYEVNEQLFEKIFGFISNVQYIDSLLSLDEKNYLIKIIQGPQTFLQNELIIKPNEINNNFYIIEEGKIEILKDKKNSNKNTSLSPPNTASSKSKDISLDELENISDVLLQEKLLDGEDTNKENKKDEPNELIFNSNNNENEEDEEVQLKVLNSGEVFNHLSLLYPSSNTKEYYRVSSNTAVLWKIDRLGFRSLILAGIYRKRLEIKEKLRKFNVFSYKKLNIRPSSSDSNIDYNNKKQIKLLTTAELNFLHDNVIVRKYKKNEIIYKENEDNTNNIYFIYKGTLSFYQKLSTITNNTNKNQPYHIQNSSNTKINSTQQLKKMKTISSGDYFGDYELFNSLNHQYSVIVESGKDIQVDTDNNSSNSKDEGEQDEDDEAIILVLSSYHLFNFLPLLESTLRENATNNYNSNINSN